MSTSKKAFTLVELIVVIVILAILATIAFLSFSSQSGSARDSVRLSDTTNIRKGLELRQAVAGVLPMPASVTKTSTGGVTATGVTSVTITEGVINSSVLKELSSGIKDPSGTEYKYSTISQGASQPLYYQLAMELENPTSMKENTINPFVDIASAASTDTSKIAQLKGNYSFDPSLPSLFVLSGSTSSASGGVYNPSICFVLDKSSTNTFSNKDNCIIKSMMNLKDYDSSLVGYWDMETTFSSGGSTYLRDISGNGNDGIFSGTMSYVASLTGSIVGKGLNFNGTNNFIDTGSGNLSSISFNSITISSIIRPVNPTSSTWGDLIGGACGNFVIGAIKNALGNKFSGETQCGLAGGGLTEGVYGTLNNSWYENDNIILTYVLSNNLIRMYKNGVPIIANTGEFAKKAVGSFKASKVYIGASSLVLIGGEFYKGTIDDMKIYNRALSPEEVRQQAKSLGF